MKFLPLIKKELKDEKNIFLFGSLALIIFFAFLFTKIGKWEKGTPLSIGIILSVSALLIYPLIKGFLSLRDEWDKDTVYLLLSLPVRRFKILLAKLIIKALEIALFSTITITSSYLIMLKEFGHTFGISIPEMLQVLGMLYLLSISLSIVPFFSYTVSRCMRRFRRIIIGITYLGFFLLYGRTVKVGSKLVGFIPNPVFTVFEPASKIIKRNVFEISGLYYFFIFSIIFMLVTLFLFEKEVEV